jgi:predicted ATP-dependent endonuclease of OLD family
MQLRLENVGIIEKADIDINGLTIIAGNNDSGKSTIGKIAYSLTKSFEDFELNYEKSKNMMLERYFRDFYILLRKDVDLRKNSELREYMERFMFYRRFDNKKLLESMNKLKEYIDNSEAILNPNAKKEVYNNIDKINSLFNESESKNAKILKSVKKIFASEFRKQINNIFRSESKISVWEGKNAVINLIITNNEILQDKNKKIDEIFPFDSSVFIETPFILTYKDALEESSHIYHVNDLLNKLEKPNLTKKEGSLNINKLINGEILFDEEENKFSFNRTTANKKIKIDIINAASGIKSLGILQLLDCSGEFNKNLLLVIDEPEVHLHPDWQVEYSKLLVKLVKKGVKILITSHSPYLIEALNKFSKEEKIQDQTKFYLSELNKEGKANIIDKTKDKSEIFDKLSEPFNRLIWS